MKPQNPLFISCLTRFTSSDPLTKLDIARLALATTALKSFVINNQEHKFF